MTVECSAESTVCTTLFQMSSHWIDFLLSTTPKFHLYQTWYPTSSKNSSWLNHVQILVKSCRSASSLFNKIGVKVVISHYNSFRVYSQSHWPNRIQNFFDVVPLCPSIHFSDCKQSCFYEDDLFYCISLMIRLMQ